MMHDQNQTNMFPRIATSLVGLFVVAAVCLTGNFARAQEDLSTAFQQARENFQPVTEQELADARAELLDRMAQLERYVRPTSTNGQRWLRFLRWDALQEALAAEGAPKPAPLAATLQRLNRDEIGLERPQFRRLADALRRYMQLSQIYQQPDQAQYYRSQLERLEAQLQQYRQEPTSATGFEIGSRLGFVAGLDRAPELVAAARREFAQPNAFMEVSTALIREGADPVNRREPVTDCILGTSIRSDAHTRGTVTVSSIPSDDRAVLEFYSKGRTHSRNTGYNGPAVIRSNSETDYTASKRVELTDEAFIGRASRARATNDTHIHSVAKKGGGLGSRIVANVGMNRARQSERRAEAIAADHAEDRIKRNFDEEVGDELRQARTRYEEEYRRPLERRGELPEHIRFSSDKDSVGLEVIQANRGQLGAAGAPPAVPEGRDMTLRLHESAVNNYSATVLGGATASETEPDQEDVKFDVTLPDWMKDAWEKRKTEETANAAEATFKPWSLKFRDSRPLSVNFADNKVRLTIHMARLKSGENTFTNWDVTGTYTPELVNGGIVLRRDGDLEMLPANFQGTLTNRQVAERRNLEEELNQRSAQGRGFPMTIEFEAIQPEGNLAKAGPLMLNEFVSDGGWLTAAWDRQAKR